MNIRVYDFRMHILDRKIIQEVNPQYLGYMSVNVFDLDMIIELCRKAFHLIGDGWCAR